MYYTCVKNVLNTCITFVLLKTHLCNLGIHVFFNTVCSPPHLLKPRPSWLREVDIRLRVKGGGFTAQVYAMRQVAFERGCGSR